MSIVIIISAIKIILFILYISFGRLTSFLISIIMRFFKMSISQSSFFKVFFFFSLSPNFITSNTLFAYKKKYKYYVEIEQLRFELSWLKTLYLPIKKLL